MTRLYTHFCSEMTVSQLYDAMIDFEMVAGRVKLSKLCVRKRNICKKQNRVRVRKGNNGRRFGNPQRPNPVGPISDKHTPTYLYS